MLVRVYLLAHDGALMVYRFATPMRTPRAEGMSGRDRILAEAANLQVWHIQIQAPSLQPLIFDCNQTYVGLSSCWQAWSAEIEQHADAAHGRRWSRHCQQRLRRHHAPQRCAVNTPCPFRCCSEIVSAHRFSITAVFAHFKGLCAACASNSALFERRVQSRDSPT
jgi:hypothetical protein